MNLHFDPPRPVCALAVRDNNAFDEARLWPDEESLLPAGAVATRRAQFASGRAAARQALLQIGMSNPPAILRGWGREPIWPAGIVGSITHCGPWAIAVVAKRENVKSVGIDLEDAERIDPHEIVDVVATPAERRWVFSSGDDSRTRLAMLFSAKESVYKMIYPLEHRFFDFQAVELAWHPERASFVGTLDGYPLEVGCQRAANFVFTHALL